MHVYVTIQYVFKYFAISVAVCMFVVNNEEHLIFTCCVFINNNLHQW